jgi:hypothetical protein
LNPEVIPLLREFSLKGGKPASTSNSPKFSQLTVSVGMFPQKTHLFTAMLWHQFFQQLWRDCKLWLQLWIHQTVKAYNLSWKQLWIHHDATPSKPEQLPKWFCTVPSYESNLWVCLETPKSILDLQNQLTRVKQRPLSNGVQKNQPSNDFQLK